VDVIIYLLPIYPLWNMQTSVRRRIRLISIFTLGGGTIMVSLLRFIVLWQLANTEDVSYIFGSVTIVTSIEFAVAIITANMPGMYAFWRAKISKKQSSTLGYNYGSGAAGTKGRSTGPGSSTKRGSKMMDSHNDEGYIRTGSQEELYPLSNLRVKGDEQNIRVDTKIVVQGEDARKVPGARKSIAKAF
jgi:hypothetical protein